MVVEVKSLKRPLLNGREKSCIAVGTAGLQILKRISERGTAGYGAQETFPAACARLFRAKTDNLASRTRSWRWRRAEPTL